ncbi:AT-rich interactive domain-containing protein 4A [Mugil cephalus]|uniref:AT-rich interactive domain-containing protein 4A n=1 Tax=Mugil cephalus TaxID=48193 RepID=UPI001FB6057D|nr:AT-rich interactive domain-containing protein 4A [Mugil cephalus]XP_047467691.1 AT-rich interactive domain-containing protein 4A [Mugil cephalus]
MKAADEPAYLTVGTDVSAKYRGAFCEAKIKTVKRMVKVKVTLKGESTSQVVQDDQVKGPLRVGSTVEVKTNEGLCSEAVISKLTDASLYTVVFDDGDEKTLRRTSLCLKGERHFAESETLDQLPLTNPEHFGTPVIGKKSNRGGRRSSQAVADEENESSSSEDEEDDRRRMNDELLGKVCSIESAAEPSSWLLALVVSPSCNDELMVKKDQCLVRSFEDGKFHTVPRRHVHAVNTHSITKSEFSHRKGFEAAQVFLRRRIIPEAWKMDMSQILDSSSSDDDENEEEKESEEEEEEDEEEKKKKKHIKEEPEEEPDPEERDHFLQQLYKFMEDRGTPINKPPVLGYKDLNLFKLFRLVYLLGGCHKIESGTVWKQVYIDLGIPVLNSAASYNVKTAYRKYLYGFEEYCRSASITFRTIHHNNPRPPTTPPSQKAEELKDAGTPQMKAEPDDDKREEAESESESDKDEAKETQMSPRGKRRCVGSRMKVERELNSRPEKSGGGGGGGENNEEQHREMRRRSNRRMDDSDKGSEDEEDDDEEEDDEDEERERRRGERSDEEEDGDSVTGTKVKVKYGRGKTQKIYEAHIKKTDVDNGEQFYLVHYYGWNVRYDEWVKADRIIWPVEKGTKKRQRKKVKNKDKDEEKDEEKLGAMTAAAKPTGAKRGRPQIRTTGSTGRSVSKTPSNEGRSNGKSSRMDTSSNMANGDNTPRRRTRRTSGMYDSDRASNEDSGNSSDDSDSEDPPDKKPSPWRGRAEAPPCQTEEDEEDDEEEEEEPEGEETSEVADVPSTANDNNNNAAAISTNAQAPATATRTPSPSMPQEKADTAPDQSEKKEKEQGEESAQENAVMPTLLDTESKPSPVTKTTTVQEKNKSSPGQEVDTSQAETSPSRTPPSSDSISKTPEQQQQQQQQQQVSSSSPAVTEEEDRSSALSSPRVKGRRSIAKETGSETPPRIPFCIPSPAPATSPSQTAVLPSPPRSVLKRGDEPMVVLHCLQRLPQESPTADSDTDSATEEEEGEEEEEGAGSSVALKRKAAEQRSAEKKLRPNRRQEEEEQQEEEVASPKTAATTPKMAASASPKTLPSPLRSERRSEGVTKPEERPPPAEEAQKEATVERLTGGAMKESEEVRAGTPPVSPAAASASPAEEMEPQMGPEALVCHEVDLDDPDEKEKPSPSPSAEHILLMMREQTLPPRLLHSALPSAPSPHLPQAQVRPFFSTSTPSSTPCPGELHPDKGAPAKEAVVEEEERGAARGEQERDSSPGFDGSASSSTTSVLSLQENKDRGQKRVTDCNSSPSAKKQKRNQKRPNTPGKVEKNGAGHSSDSEDQSRVSSLSKSQKPRCPGLSSPSSHKDKQSFPSPQRTYKWTFQIDELDSMSSTERISFLQEKLQEIRKCYMSLKSEVANIDRRRKRLKKKEREVSNTTASTSSGSSDTGMSPSSASPTQNTVAVECR